MPHKAKTSPRNPYAGSQGISFDKCIPRTVKDRIELFKVCGDILQQLADGKMLGTHGFAPTAFNAV